MNRNRFNAPPAENRISQNIYNVPPPNFNWAPAPSPNEFPMQMNSPPFPNPPVQPVYNQNPSKKSYCKTCNSWAVEPYDIHITTPAHMQNKSNARNVSQPYESNIQPEQLMSIKCTPRGNNQPYDSNSDTQFNMSRKPPPRQNEPPYEQNNNNNNNVSFPISRKVAPRANEQPYEPNNAPFAMARKVPIRTNSQPHEPINPAGFPIEKKSTSRVSIPPFNTGNLPNSNEDLSDNSVNKRIRVKKSRPTTNQQNPAGYNQNDFKGSHPPEGPYFDKNDGKRIDETTKSKSSNEGPVSTSIIANRGREMLLPVSGIYCTLCDEFFRNTDTAETKHCNSSSHIEAYERLIGKLKQHPHAEKRPNTDSKSDKQPNTKRPKSTPKTTKPTKPVNKSPETIEKVDSVKEVEKVAVVGAPVVTRDKVVDNELNVSGDFQGPDVSLDFPDEIEDYDD